MQEENPNHTVNKEDIIDLAMKKVPSSTEDINNDDDKENNGTSNHEDELIAAEADDVEDDVKDRRKYLRSEFTYPAEFKVFYQNLEHISFNGYLKDVSISGACLQLDDKYGRFNIKDTTNVKIKISFSVPNEDKVSIFAIIRWITKIDPRTFSVKIGIEFKDMEGWQLDIIEKLIGMKNKDHNMMWNLWEQYNNWR
jgi:hypothetical protein